MYASWYPACRVALSHEGVAPEWRRALAGEHDPAVVDSVLEETRQRLDPFLPGLASLPLVRPLAGTIVGHGASDIDDLGSELHQRRDPGPRRLGSYVSMFTGKFTRAPLQAVRLAEELAAG